jgi:hypothetical protein
MRTTFGNSPKGTLALEILYFMTGAFVALAVVMHAHGVKLKLPTGNEFPACYQNICFSSVRNYTIGDITTIARCGIAR